MKNGRMAVEVIFDTSQKTILDYMLIDPDTLSRTNGCWVQYDDIPAMRRVLDEAVILTNF